MVEGLYSLVDPLAPMLPSAGEGFAVQLARVGAQDLAAEPLDRLDLDPLSAAQPTRCLDRAHVPLERLGPGQLLQLLAAGIPAKVVSERLGHANIAITMDTYSHVLPGLDAQAAGTVARLILGDPDQEPARPVDKALTTGPWAGRTRKEVEGEPAVQEEGDRGDSNPRPSGPQPDALTT